MPDTFLTILDAHLAYGDTPLLDGVRLSVLAGERIGLIGRNGTGKSTLLQVIAGRAHLDDGEVRRRDGLRIEIVEQEPELPAAPTLRESLLLRHAHPSDHQEWNLELRLEEFLTRFELDPDRPPHTSSGGERKRAALALALAIAPDLLLLDEPTNHLDIQGIELVEQLLLKVPASIVITHDRTFLDRVTTRIVELDRGVLRSYPGNYAAYETRKDDELAAEAVANRRFDKFWAQEEAWIRQGVEARRTRSAGRVYRLQRLRDERAVRRERLGNVKLNVDPGDRSGRVVAELEDVSKRFGDRAIVERLSMRIMRGDRIGIIGPNGAGKTTLLRLMLGLLEPDSGRVQLGTNLLVAYFDQMREQLDPERSVADTISPGSDWVTVNGQSRHVASYLKDFLFSPQRARSPVKMLSGGERNRLLLARLFASPANALVLDEPTNDLDIESLELLEQTLQEYPGTLLLVSHDRTFLDNVVTQTLAAEGDGTWRESVGGYADWLRQRPAPAPAVEKPPEQPARPAGTAMPPKARARFSFKERRELEGLPAEIAALENEQKDIMARMSRGDYYAQGPQRIKDDRARSAEIEQLLLEKLERWEALESLATKSGD